MADKSKRAEEVSEEAHTTQVAAEDQPNAEAQITQVDAEDQPNEEAQITQVDAEDQPNEEAQITQVGAEDQPNEEAQITQADAEDQPNEEAQIAQVAAEDQPNEEAQIAQVAAEDQHNEEAQIAQVAAEDQPNEEAQITQADAPGTVLAAQQYIPDMLQIPATPLARYSTYVGPLVGEQQSRQTRVTVMRHYQRLVYRRYTTTVTRRVSFVAPGAVVSNLATGGAIATTGQLAVAQPLGAVADQQIAAAETPRSQTNLCENLTEDGQTTPPLN